MSIENHDKFDSWVRTTFGHPHRVAGADWVVDCPSCGADKRFTLNPEKRVFNCYRCGHKGRLSGLLMNEYGFTFRQADDLLENRVDLNDLPVLIQQWQEPPTDPANLQAEREELIESMVPLDELLRSAVEPFARSRGFTYELFQQLGFRYATTFPYAGRLVIPVYDEQGQLGYFQARSLHGEQPPYMAPPRRLVEKGSTIFNLGPALHWVKQGWPLYICEGAFNAMSIGGNAIATFGKDLTQQQVTAIQTVLLPHAKQVVVAFDFGADKQAFHLQTLSGAKRLVLPDKRDLNDWYREGGTEAVRWMLEHYVQ